MICSITVRCNLFVGSHVRFQCLRAGDGVADRARPRPRDVPEDAALRALALPRGLVHRQQQQQDHVGGLGGRGQEADLAQGRADAPALRVPPTEAIGYLQRYCGQRASLG